MFLLAKLLANSSTSKTSLSSLSVLQFSSLHQFSWLDFLDDNLSNSIVFPKLRLFYLTTKSFSP